MCGSIILAQHSHLEIFALVCDDVTVQWILRNIPSYLRALVIVGSFLIVCFSLANLRERAEQSQATSLKS
jgi:hypothetical protein